MNDDLPPHETTFGIENTPDDPGPDAFVGAFALLMRGEGPDQYAAIRDGETIDLIRAPRLEGETYRDSLLREVAWRLDLDAKRDLVTSGVPRAHLNSRLCGKGSGEPKWYICEFYVTRLYGQRWKETLTKRDDLVWLTGGELMNGGRPGLPLKADVHDLIRIADLIPPDER